MPNGTAQSRRQVFERLERFYDAVPRDAAEAAVVGGLVLFVRTGRGWPYYARPRLGAAQPPSLADVTAVRAKQRELGLPETFEWVPETTPSLLATAEQAGLAVLHAPLLVLDPTKVPPPDAFTETPVRLADPSEASFAADVAQQRAVAEIAFAAEGTARGPSGPADRDAVLRALDPDELAEQRRRVERGRHALSLVRTADEGVVASGMLQRVDDVAEIVGVATLPSARRRGLGAAVTAHLARHALAAGVDLVFLSAGGEDIARVYARVGFHRIGTVCIAAPPRP